MGGKRLIKCSGCKNQFFTKKLIFSKSEIEKTKLALDEQLKRQLTKLNNLQKAKKTLDESIEKQEKNIYHTQKNIDKLNVKVQCSQCGERLIAVDNEVEL